MVAHCTASDLTSGSSSVHCFERAYWGRQAKAPVTLVVFDFDETLTTVSVFPKDPDFERRVGFPLRDEYTHWCYETPGADATMGMECRVSKLREMLQRLIGGSGRSRVLSVVTRNPCGVVACLNSLMKAGLADFFSVILGMQDIKGMPQGVYRDGSRWRTFHPPVMKFDEAKADVLSRIVDDPTQWFPTLRAAGADEDVSVLRDLKLANVVLVDDDEDNFQSANSKILRCCRVGTYAAHHPKLGFQEKMGGIGAYSDEDYSLLVDFVEEPWKFPWHLNKGSEPGEGRAAPLARGGQMMERRSAEVDAQAHVEAPFLPQNGGNCWVESSQAMSAGAPNCPGYVASGFVGYMVMTVPAMSVQSFPVPASGPSNFNCHSGQQLVRAGPRIH